MVVVSTLGIVCTLRGGGELTSLKAWSPYMVILNHALTQPSVLKIYLISTNIVVIWLYLKSAFPSVFSPAALNRAYPWPKVSHPAKNTNYIKVNGGVC